MYKISDNLKSKYEIKNSFLISEQNLEVVEIEHIITKAKVVLFICDDENRVFNIAFKTPVNNSKGTPHILEHSVLCGSRKYNVKDPFMELAKGSLNTFLNAMTFPDKTCYPVASANLKDFYNLFDVYLDAVFYPNVIRNEKLFRQEGWHYEIENSFDELKVNGVVYNEMKGVFSDPDSILEYSILSNLFEGTNYSFESGGKPSDIIDLSYEEFVDFHHRYYSPSNSIIYFYGKLDYNDILLKLDMEYLQNFSYIDCDAKFLDCENIVKDKLLIDYYNVDSEDVKGKSYIAYSLALSPDLKSIDVIVLQIIDYILFTSDSAILKNILLEKGFGESIVSKVEEGIKNGFFSVISQNIDDEKCDSFIKTIKDSIIKILNDGIDESKMKAAINSVYFDLAEGEYGTMPRGLFFTIVSLETYLYGKDVATFIYYKDAFDYLNSIDLTDKENIIYKTIKKVFIDNNHTAINVLKPKYGLLKENDEKLKKILGERKNHLSKDEIDNVIKEMKELKEYQKLIDSKEALSCIPRLKITDIDRDKKIIDYVVENNDNVDTIISYDNDKDIVYIGISFDITNLSKEEIYLFSLISSVLSKIDLKNDKVSDFENYVDMNTGGLSIKIEAYENKVLFSMNIKSTIDNVDKAFSVLYKLFAESKFADKEKIKILISERKTESFLNLLSSGHIASMTRARSNREFYFNISDKISSSCIANYLYINSLSKTYDESFDIINDAMVLLYKKLHRCKLYLKLCMNKKYHDSVLKSYDDFSQKMFKDKMRHVYSEIDEKNLSDLICKIKTFIPFDDFDKKVAKEAILTPSDVNFCAMASSFDKKLYTGRLMLLRTVFNYEYLWTNIRVLGGAYGCMSFFNKNGHYAFASYRDPNLKKTNETFIGIRDYLKNVRFSKDDVDKFIIGTIGLYDNPLSIYGKHIRNVAAYFNNISNDDMNCERHDILDTTPSDINDLAKLFDNIFDSDGCALICLSKSEEANEEYDKVWKLVE